MVTARLLAVTWLALSPAAAVAQSTLADSPVEVVEVTSTPIPEKPRLLPASVTILDGDELRSWGYSDLKSALRLAGGVDIASGGDAGPASAVPELWGLKEFDAFLLVVDGVPWGGAFNPEIATMSLVDVQSIEIVKGPAPVMYGGTSFVGVIQVRHTTPGLKNNAVEAAGGSHGSGLVDVATDTPKWLGFSSRVVADAERREFTDDRMGYDRAHVLWRNTRSAGGGDLEFDLDYHYLNQRPGSPTPVVGDALSTDVPLDANHNPDGAYMDPRRATLNVAYAHPMSIGKWSTLLSVSHSTERDFRGFLVDDTTVSPNAHGFREDIDLTQVYFAGQATFNVRPNLAVVAGLDYTYGHGSGSGGDFDYDVALDGSNPPTSDTLPPAADIHIHDIRNFAGLFGYVAWNPGKRWRIEGGYRLNVVKETRDASTLDFGSGTYDAGSDSQSQTRGSGSLGVGFVAWEKGNDHVDLFANYRDTFKPAAIDFGLDSQATILDPETAQSYEIGLKQRFFDGRLDVDLSGFTMTMDNLVVSQDVGGLPTLVNSGSQRFRGGELEIEGRVGRGVSLRAAYSNHDARYVDSLRDLGAGPVQLAGNRLPMSPRNLASFGVLYHPAAGFFCHADIQYVGDRYMDEENQALAASYETWSAGIGWQHAAWQIRLDGQNLSDNRSPSAQSELGDGQLYRVYPRHITLAFRWAF